MGSKGKTLGIKEVEYIVLYLSYKTRCTASEHQHLPPNEDTKWRGVGGGETGKGRTRGAVVVGSLTGMGLRAGTTEKQIQRVVKDAGSESDGEEGGSVLQAMRVRRRSV